MINEILFNRLYGHIDTVTTHLDTDLIPMQQGLHTCYRVSEGTLDSHSMPLIVHNSL